MAIIINFLVTIVKLFVLGVFYYFIFLSFGARLDYISVILIANIVMIISLIPISLSGLGIRESSAVFLYSLIGAPTEVTLATYILANVLNYFFAILAIIIYWNELDGLKKFIASLKKPES